MCLENPRYRWLDHDGRHKRRTIADGLEICRSLPFVGPHSLFRIRVHRFVLPTQETVGLVRLELEVAEDLISVVSMPACRGFIGVRIEGGQIADNIFRLDGASVDTTGCLELPDGRRIKAVELETVGLYPPTDLDLEIVTLAVFYANKSNNCFRYLPPEAAQPDAVPIVAALDCEYLRSIKIDSIEKFHKVIVEHHPRHANRPKETVRKALLKFGVTSSSHQFGQNSSSPSGT